MNTLTSAIIRLFETERFYGEIILSMDKILDKNFTAIAGVCIKDKVIMYVNPERFNDLSEIEQVAVLKHECAHLINDHIPRAKELYPEIYQKDQGIEDAIINRSKHTLINISADCAINPGIPGIIKDAMFPINFSLEDGQTMEWYIENLKNNEKLKDLNNFDDHSIWAESEGDKEILKQKIKNLINESAKNTRNAGKMTAENELIVDKINKSTKDWRSELKRFTAKNMQLKIDSTRTKRNRRYGIKTPGVIKTPELHIGVAMDTSGSISDEALIQFISEIAKISKYSKVTVVEADSEIKNSYDFDPRKKYTIKGRGGTAYQPAFDYFNEETDIDGLIYFGDMDCFDAEAIKQPKYPVLWAVVGNQSPPVNWGSKISIEVGL